MSEVKPLKCPQCEHELPGLPPERCPACRCLLTFRRNDSFEPGTLTPQRLTWGFWLVFLATPLMAVAAMSPRLSPRKWLGSAVDFLPGQEMVLAGTVIGGALASGYFLARTHAQSRTALTIGTILWALGVLIVYAGLTFMGCLMIMGTSR